MRRSRRPALNLGWTSPPFEIPADIRAAWDRREKGARVEQEWRTRFAAYKAEFPALAAELERRMAGELPGGFADLVNAYIGAHPGRGQGAGDAPILAGGIECVRSLAARAIGRLGGSDALERHLAQGFGGADARNRRGGNYLHFGVREFGMSAMLNGIVCHGGFIPYGGTFLTFSDYARNAVRMACLMRLRVIFVYTHDSIGLGEDGPTHQPIEHLASLRLIPHMDLWRPCDGGRDRGGLGRGHRESRRSHAA